MTIRKRSPTHDYWHPKVEGQIRDAMKAHPEWLNNINDRVVTSIAKRIVGEIVAGCILAPVPDDVDTRLRHTEVNGDGATIVTDRSGCAPLLHPDRKTES